MNAKLDTPDPQMPLVVSLLGLTFVTGVIDAISFLGLGRVFTANMTGNVVFLGFALGGGASDLSVLRSLSALAAFGCGGIVGGRMITGSPQTPEGLLLKAMSLEIVFLAVAAVAVLATRVEVRDAIPYVVIALTGIAMGLRNAVVRKLAVPDLTTTVLTLTVTGLAADSRLAGGAGTRAGRRLMSLLAMALGALAGAAVLARYDMTAALTMAIGVVGGFAVYLRSRMS